VTANPDGTGECDRCGVSLAGYGVLDGMLAAYYDEGQLVSHIYCYVNGCRDHILAGRLNHDTPGLCTDCGTATVRSLASGVIANDEDPDTDGPRQMMFCHFNGCSTRFLTVAGEA
jgi:hypothetical protein